MTDQIHFLRGNQADLDNVYLFHRHYTGDIRSRYVWNWEYGDQNPFRNDLVIGCDGESIIATQGVMEIPLICDSKMIVSGKNESLLIDKDYRKMGLSGRLYHYALEVYRITGYELLWGFSRKALPTLRNADFLTFHRPMSRAVLPLDFRKAGAVLIGDKHGLRSHLFKLALSMATAYSRTIWRLSSVSVFKKNKSENQLIERLVNNSDLHEFILAQSKSLPDMIFIDQDPKYIHWRLGNSPLPVRSVYLYSGDRLIGFMHLCFRDYGLEILDLLADSSRSTMILISEVRRISLSSGIGLVLYTGNRYNVLNRKVLSFLKSLGFWVLPGINDFVLRLLDYENNTRVTEIANWYMTGLWYEGI